MLFVSFYYQAVRVVTKLAPNQEIIQMQESTSGFGNEVINEKFPRNSEDVKAIQENLQNRIAAKVGKVDGLTIAVLNFQRLEDGNSKPKLHA